MRYSDLPTACPNCQRAFSKHLQTPKFQKKALAALIGGIVLNMIWPAIFYFLLVEQGIVVVPKSLGAIAAIYFGPAVLGLIVAMALPKIVTVQCRGCNWSNAYIMNNRQEAID
jgi:hypothetical protein